MMDKFFSQEYAYFLGLSHQLHLEAQFPSRLDILPVVVQEEALLRIQPIAGEKNLEDAWVWLL